MLISNKIDNQIFTKWQIPEDLPTKNIQTQAGHRYARHYYFQTCIRLEYALIRAMLSIGPSNMFNRPMSDRGTHGSIFLPGETRTARKHCLLLTHQTLSPFDTRQSSNTFTSYMMHSLGIRNIPS